MSAGLLAPHCLAALGFVRRCHKPDRPFRRIGRWLASTTGTQAKRLWHHPTCDCCRCRPTHLSSIRWNIFGMNYARSVSTTRSSTPSRHLKMIWLRDCWQWKIHLQWSSQLPTGLGLLMSYRSGNRITPRSRGTLHAAYTFSTSRNRPVQN